MNCANENGEYVTGKELGPLTVKTDRRTVHAGEAWHDIEGGAIALEKGTY